MRKKILAVVAMAVITTLAFTGCGKSNSASKDSGKAAGTSGAITVISREEGSGTRGAFTELMKIVDDKDQDITTQTAEITNSTSVMLSTVAQNQKAIGYVSLGSLSNSVKALKVDGNEATAENVKAGTYKVSRTFNICYKENKLTDFDKQFIEFIMSDEGQKLVDAEGYISVGAEGNKPYEGTDAKGKITLAGSTSVAPLMDKLKDAFNKKAPNVSIEIQESGSSAGIQSAIEGAVEIGMSSRELKDEEKTDLTVKQIAMDGIAVIVNNDNTLDNITSDQIKDIYTGKTTEWSDVK
mgnify:FL=1